MAPSDVSWNSGFIGATAMVADCHTYVERGQAHRASGFMIFGLARQPPFPGALLQASSWQIIDWLLFPAIALILVALVWQAVRKKRPSNLIAEGKVKRLHFSS